MASMFESHHLLHCPFGDSQYRSIIFDHQTSCTNKTPVLPQDICLWNTLSFLLACAGTSSLGLCPGKPGPDFHINHSFQSFKERTWSLLFQKGPTRVDLWAAKWVTIHCLLSFLPYKLRALPSPSFPMATSCHFEKTPSILWSGQFPEMRGCCQMLLGRALLVNLRFGADPSRVHPSSTWLWRTCDFQVWFSGGWVWLTSHFLLGGPSALGEWAFGGESLLKTLITWERRDCGNNKCPCIIYHCHCLVQAASFHWLLTFKGAGNVQGGFPDSLEKMSVSLCYLHCINSEGDFVLFCFFWMIQEYGGGSAYRVPPSCHWWG